jgi:triosephosphate isomerase
VGAQNCHEAVSGAYTGEIAPAMLNSIGLTSVIIGHSERRQIYNESHALLKQKVDAALTAGLTVVFCIGETLDEREAGKEYEVVKQQLNDSLFHLDKAQMANVIVAYEPVWAIGTGVTASPEQAQDIHAYIRTELNGKYGELAEDIPVLYGGSVKPSNAGELFSKKDVDGGLIGGASLKASDFNSIIETSSGLV